MKLLIVIYFLIFSFCILLLSIVNLKSQKSDSVPEVAKATPQFFQDPIIVAVGDIACESQKSTIKECRHLEVSNLVAKINPDAVLIPGDLQYQNGSYEKYLKYYDTSWGKFKDVTYPVPGNHEYSTQNAQGYFKYFSDKKGVESFGFYSFNLGDWHIVALNSNCWAVGGCGKDSKMVSWLKMDLEQNPKKCTLAFWHHPLFSSAHHGPSTLMKYTWTIIDNYGVDVVINGHDHVYERFAAQDADGSLKQNGVMQFTVGTGGRNLYAFNNIMQNSKVRFNNEFGVLKLKLLTSSFDWSFVTIDNKIIDSGSMSCN